MTHWRDSDAHAGRNGCVIILAILLGFWGGVCFFIYYLT